MVYSQVFYGHRPPCDPLQATNNWNQITFTNKMVCFVCISIESSDVIVEGIVTSLLNYMTYGFVLHMYVLINLYAVAS